MKKTVTFKTELFESQESKPHFINERCFGKDLAAWLRQQLHAAPFTLDEVIQEDYGWGFWAKAGEDTYWMAIGIFDESIGSEDAEWSVTVAADASLNLFRRLFHKPKLEDLLSLCSAIDAALHAEPKIREVQWWPREPFAGVGSAHPEAPVAV